MLFRERLQRALAAARIAWFDPEVETLTDVRAQRAAAIDIVREIGAELAFLRNAYERVTGLEAPGRLLADDLRPSEEAYRAGYRQATDDYAVEHFDSWVDEGLKAWRGGEL